MDAEMQMREANLVSFAGAVWRAEGCRGPRTCSKWMF
jgi:hypothetical protein